MIADTHRIHHLTNLVSTMKKLFVFLFVFLSTLQINAQVDTEFWFAAPEVSKGQIGYDDPVAFRVSTFDVPATVTLSLPAKPSFVPITVTVAAGQTRLIYIAGNQVEAIECKPANQVLNTGVLISSTAPITAYYEVIGQAHTNPELFALKGSHALGTRFYTPFQRAMSNSTIHSPLPFASFDIVATQNNTEITIKPTQNIVGHAAGSTFTITLNRGQTFSCQSTSANGVFHPTGSYISSNKPVAVTVKDDLVNGGDYYGGFCRDLIGDQLVPTDYIGTKYVALKGGLSGSEIVSVVATEDNTAIRRNGSLIATINAGETSDFDIQGDCIYIETSEPAYVFHVSGIGCEVAGELLPSLDCGGSASIRFVRSYDTPMYLMVVVQAGSEDDFKVNGSTNIFNPAYFKTVPGSNGNFKAMVREFSIAEIQTNKSTLVENTTGLFHLGYINGNDSDGALYGFFSDFLNKIVVEDTLSLCAGDTVTYLGQKMWAPGVFTQIIESVLDCDTLFRITAIESPTVNKTITKEICSGQSIEIYGTSYSQEGEYAAIVPSNQGNCDTLVTIQISFSDFVRDTVKYYICSGDSIRINGKAYWDPVILRDTIERQTLCDSIIVIIIDAYAFDDSRFLSADTVWCNSTIQLSSNFEETVWSTGQVGFSIDITAPGYYFATYLDMNGCDHIDTVFVSQCCDADAFYVPNIFSPESSPPNNLFRIYNRPDCSIIRFTVFDRWGNMIFRSSSYDDSWDGTFRGKVCTPGVYIWYVELGSTGNLPSQVLKGDVTLIK